MLAIALAMLLGTVTVAEGGLVFQPALSPDGTRVAYAADEGGDVKLYVAPTAAAPESATETARVLVATLGKGAAGHRLASRALAHRPWAEDGSRILFLAATPDGDELLYVANPDGTGEPLRIGPDRGLIETAAWATRSALAYTYRTSKKDDVQRVKVTDLASREDSDTRDLIEGFFDYTRAVDIAPSPGGQWFAMLVLTGPRDARKRELRVYHTTGRDVRVPESDGANFLTWSPDGEKLFFLDTWTRQVRAFDPAQERASPAVTRGLVSIVAMGEYLLGTDGDGKLWSVNAATGQKGKVLATGYVPVSASTTKLALVRMGGAGAAIVVADVTRDAIEAGDIGLPKPEETPAPEKPASEAPTDGSGAVTPAAPAPAGALTPAGG